MAESYVGTLDQAAPPGSAYISTVDEQLRLIKAACKASFPSVTGAVTLSHTTINGLPASVTSAQAALKNILDPHGYTTLGSPAAATVVPKGGIIMWNHNVGAIPSGWRLCDGGTYNSVITPDLRNRFIIGEPSSFGAGTRPLAETATIAANGSHTHTPTVAGHALTVAEIPAHSHGLPMQVGTSQSGVNNATVEPDLTDDGDNLDTFTDGGSGASTGAAHAHTATMTSDGAHAHTISAILPIRYVLAFICYCGG